MTKKELIRRFTEYNEMCEVNQQSERPNERFSIDVRLNGIEVMHEIGLINEKDYYKLRHMVYKHPR